MKRFQTAENHSMTILYLLLCLLPLLVESQCQKRKTVLISMDGFWFGYLDKLKQTLGSKSNIWQLIGKSANANQGIRPVYPSITLPSHTSMITGKYVDDHGLVGKKFYEPHSGQQLEATKLGSAFWSYVKGEPVWATYAKKYGEKKVGCISWLGCSAPYQGIKLSNYVPYSSSNSWTNAAQQLVQWLQNGVDFAMFYYPQPDLAGHMYGPHSQQVLNELLQMDRRVGVLVKLLKQANLFEHVNLILTSDHGMAEGNNAVKIPHRKDLFDIWIRADAYWVVEPKPGKSTTEVMNYLKQFGGKDKFKIYRKDEIPDHMHYRHSSRIGKILIVAEPSYILSTDGHTIKGQHGYNRGSSRMRTIFIGHGPLFKQGYSVPIDFATKHTNLVVRQSLCLPQPEYADAAYLQKKLSFVHL